MITAAQSVIFQILFLLFSFDLKLSGKNIYLSQTELTYLGMIPLLTLSFSGRVLVYQHNSVNLTRKSNSIEQPRHHLPSIHLFVHLFIKLFCCFFKIKVLDFSANIAWLKVVGMSAKKLKKR